MALPATTEERLDELRRRIEALAARTQRGTEDERLAVQRRVAALREGEACVRAAVHDAAAIVEESVLQLDARVNLAEQSAAADIAEDIATFVVAVTDELHSWDVYLERLQVRVASSAGDGRDQGEQAIRELRRSRNALVANLAEATTSSGEAWRGVREHVRAARDELESGATEVEAGLGKGGDRAHGARRHPGPFPR